MNNKDTFLMTSAVLAVWAKSNMRKAFGICVGNKDKELLKVFVILKSNIENDIDLIMNVFGNNQNFVDAFMYTTFKPSANFVAAAQSKKLTNLYYLQNPKENLQEIPVESFSKPLLCNFGIVIDLLAQYIDII